MRRLCYSILLPKSKVTTMDGKNLDNGRKEIQLDLSFYQILAPSLALHMLPHALELSNAIPHIITKMGEEGCLYVGRNGEVPTVEYFEPKHILSQDIKSVTGAGDR